MLMPEPWLMGMGTAKCQHGERRERLCESWRDWVCGWVGKGAQKGQIRWTLAAGERQLGLAVTLREVGHEAAPWVLLSPLSCLGGHWVLSPEPEGVLVPHM